MISADQLTEEQRAVVRHDGGPAAVLAVPGAGKTTAVVHRLRALVEEREVPPQRLLASSFNRATVQELSAALGGLGLHGVETRTLHGIGHMILREADAHPAVRRETDAPSPDACAYRLARRALREHADEQGLHPGDLSITGSDLVDQVGAWKQQLAYADPGRASLPDAARARVRTAQHENEAFLELYRRFEAHRERQGWLTYPDMLREGWTCLVRDEALRERLQAAYDHVVVDEFQDLSRAQFFILDHLTAPDRKYLVVGDDDQCIYGWRGADPSYLLGFADRYDAEEYRMQDSFRLPAAPLVLARTAIEANDDRHPKQPRLTRGVGGPTALIRRDEAAGVAEAIAARAEHLRADTPYDLSDLVVLVRTYGQTPPLEQALLDRDLPYRVRGRVPFYRRRSVQTLLRYLYGALLERRRRRDGFDRPQSAEHYADRFSSIINRPNRYVERARVDYTVRRARETGRSILALLTDQQSEMPDDTAERVGSFVSVMEGLVDRLDAPAGETVRDLVDRLDFEAHLRGRSPTAARGAMRVRTVRALCRFAEGRDSIPALLRRVREVAAAHSSPSEGPVLELRSIHRAKGAEWPVVFLPGCNDGTLPLEADAPDALDEEEERRLFYVALTRTRDHLYLGVRENAPPSPFLKDADASAQVEQCDHVRETLRRPPGGLSDAACARLCQSIADLQLEPYIRRWWRPEVDYAAALHHRLSALEPRVEAARAERATHEQKQAEFERAQSRLPAEVEARISTLQKRLGTPTLAASLSSTAPAPPTDATLTFSQDADQIQVQWQGRSVARVDPFSAPLDASTLLALPWSQLVSRPVKVRRGAGTLRLKFDWDATAAQLLDAERAACSPPPDLDEETRLLTSDAFERGHACLQRRLASVLGKTGAESDSS
ncbi:MAG: ATP-dependent helicase [Salinibacter sp.]